MILALDAAGFRDRHPGVSHGVASAMTEAASVALARRHASPTEVALDDAGQIAQAVLSWAAPDAQALRAWRDPARATEWGAEAVAILCVERRRGLVVVDRALRGSHVDYYLGQPGDSLERAASLEVGGTQDGRVAGLLEEKRRQATRNPDRLPTLAVAVRFHDPRVMMANVETDPT